MSMRAYQTIVYGVYIEDAYDKICELFGEDAWMDNEIQLEGGTLRVESECEWGDGAAVGFVIDEGATLESITEGFAKVDKLLKTHPFLADMTPKVIKLESYS